MKNIEKQRKVFDGQSLNLNDTRYSKILKILKKKNRGKLLEIGFCDGTFLKHMKNLGWDISGIEISKENVLNMKKTGIPVVCHDMNNKMPFDNSCFDFIVAGEVIEHIFDDLDFLNDCYRVLKKGGLLIFTTPNLLSLKNRILMLLGKNPRYALAEYHYHVYTKNILEKLISRSDFSLSILLGNFIIYSSNREKCLGSFFEKTANFYPSLAENFIVILKKT